MAATYSLEAGSSFPDRKKARQARIGHRGHMLAATYSLEAGSNFPDRKKRVGECHSPTLLKLIKNNLANDYVAVYGVFAL